MLSPNERALELALPSVWARRHRLIEGRPWSFVGREFLIAIHDETAPSVSVRKGNQVGVTEAVMNIAFCDVDARIPTMFVLPTERVRDRHVSARVNPMIKESDYLRAMFDESDSMRVKTSGSTPLYFEGSNSKSGGHSVPVGSLIIDEVDRCMQSALPEFEKRLSGQRSPRLRAISTPTYPGRGIDARFERSDQRFWTIACPHCGHKGTLDWDDAAAPGFPELAAVMRWDGWPEKRFLSTDERESAASSARLECLGCGLPWSHEQRVAAVSAGVWTPRHPGRSAAGFHVPQVVSPVRTAKDLLLDYFESIATEEAGSVPNAVRTWHNGVRGVAYLSTSEQIEVAEVEALVTSSKPSDGAACVAGIDVGSWKHVCIATLAGRVAVWEFHKFKSFAEVVAFLESRNVALAVWDAHPEKEAVETICQEDAGRSFRAWTPADQLEPTHWDDERHIVRISRVSFISALQARIRGKTAAIVRNDESEVACHHLTRDTVVDAVSKKTGDAVRRVVKISTEDHYLWAAAYAEVAMRRCGVTSAELDFGKEERDDSNAPIFAQPLARRMDRTIGVRELGADEAETEDYGQGFSAW